MSLLRARFERRLVVVTAGPGFGKSTLLAQAAAENRLAPRGVDVWVPCRPREDRAGSLARSILVGLGEQPTSNPLARLHDALWREGPDPTALLIDDVQHLGTSTEAVALLEALVGEAPDHIHFVLAGRAPQPVPLARLATLGEVVTLGEADLAFSPQEVRSLAELRGADLDADAEHAGWPALVELAMAVGSGHRPADFLWEEVLALATPSERTLLGTLVRIGGGDGALLSELLGRQVDPATELARIPLVEIDSTGWCTANQLWELALGDHPLDRRAVELAARRAETDGRLDEAWGLLSRHGLWEGALAMIERVCSEVNPPATPAMLADWCAAVPGEHRSAPAYQLADALSMIVDDVPAGLDALEGARRSYQEAGRASDELVVLAHIGNTAFFSDDVRRGAAAMARVLELEAAEPEVAAPWAHLARAMVADLSGDLPAIADHLSRVPADALAGSVGAMVTRYRGTIELFFGSLSSADRLARQSAEASTPAFVPVALTLALWARWLDGDHGGAEDLLPAIRRPPTGGTERHDSAAATNAALLAAWSGRLDVARELLDDVPLEDDGASIVSQTVRALAQITLAVVSGDEKRAAEMMAAELAVRPLLGRPATAHFRVPALSWVLAPETRPIWDRLPLGEGPRRAVDLAHLLMGARAGRSTPTDVEVSPEHIWSCLPVPWAMELAVALRTADRRTSDVLVEWGGRAGRDHLRRLVKGRSEHAARARALLANSPTPPEEPLEVRLLGPVRLLRGGRDVDAPDWRRERVRSLLVELVQRRQATRGELAAALWPDLDDTRAANNLRVTLTYLLRLLEPHRADGEPAYFVRTDRSTVRLEGIDRLVVDQWLFDDALARAHRLEAQGTPSLALDAYLAACDAYHGDLLADMGLDAAGETRREHYRSRFVSAAVRAGELTVNGGQPDRALQLAERALSVDPWSESAHRVVVRALLARGDRPAARRSLDRAMAALEELALPPERATVMLARRLEGVPAGTDAD